MGAAQFGRFVVGGYTHATGHLPPGVSAAQAQAYGVNPATGAPLAAGGGEGPPPLPPTLAPAMAPAKSSAKTSMGFGRTILTSAAGAPMQSFTGKSLLGD